MLQCNNTRMSLLLIPPYFLRGGLFERPLPDGFPVVLGQPPPFPEPRDVLDCGLFERPLPEGFPGVLAPFPCPFGISLQCSIEDVSLSGKYFLFMVSRLPQKKKKCVGCLNIDVRPILSRNVYVEYCTLYVPFDMYQCN